jgi:hypothetical protein
MTKAVAGDYAVHVIAPQGVIGNGPRAIFGDVFGRDGDRADTRGKTNFVR